MSYLPGTLPKSFKEYEDPVPFKQQGGSNLYNIYEWVAIAIHEPEKFVKVV